MGFITRENARDLARLGNLKRWGTPKEPEESHTNGESNHAIDDAIRSDPFAVELERAMDETLQELRDADTAKDRAACAQALRNLRETYHLVTGLERPGVSKGKRGKTSKRDYHKPASSQQSQATKQNSQAPPEPNG